MKTNYSVWSEDMNIGIAEILEIVKILFAFAGGTFITNVFNKRWERANKSSKILEKQYFKVIFPIYRELQLTKDENEMISNIERIIYNNFYLLPEQLLEAYENITVDKETFNILISDLYVFLRNELGYSKIKVSKEVKEKGKLLAYQKALFIIDRIVLNFLALSGFILTILSIAGIHLAFTTQPYNTKYLIVFSIFLFLGFLLIIMPITSFVKSDFKSKK